MKLQYKLGIALFMLASLCASIKANDLSRREFTKVIKKEYDISKNGTTAILNKYGKVVIKTWDRNRVKIDVTIIVNAASEDAAQKVFDRIDVKFYADADYVKAETFIEPFKKEWWDWRSANKSDYTINYEVYMPPTNNLELTNKYGDSYIAPLEGKLSLDVKYGNFKAQTIKNNAQITLGYGSGTLESAQNLTSTVSYSKLYLGEVSDAEIVSSYSRLTIEKAANLRTNSKYDNYEVSKLKEFRNEGKYDSFKIGQVDNVVIIGKYSQVNVEKLLSLLDLNLEYGGAGVLIVSKDFSNINLIGKYTDFKINIESGANFLLDASATYAGISYPAGLKVEREIEKGTSHEVKGHLGKEGARSKIIARLSYGGLKVRQE